MPAAAPASAGPEHHEQAMIGLHVCRSFEELHDRLMHCLEQVLPATGVALGLTADDGVWQRVVATAGKVPWSIGAVLSAGETGPAGATSHPIRYRNHELGRLWLTRTLVPEEMALVDSMLAHYGVALGNLTLNEESRHASEQYCASLKVLEEGIALFQEPDREVVTARFLDLGRSMLAAEACGLYVLDEIGNPDSELRLGQTLGVPETLLASFRGRDGLAWPRCLLDAPTACFCRETDPTLGGLDPAVIPDILHNLVVLPLRYHGVVAGVCVLFNVPIEPGGARDQLERVDHLGQLGAALLHRMSLEQAAVRSQAITRELELARTIQQRLLPAAAPASEQLEFCWRSVAAQRIGGDYLDLLAAEPGSVLAVIGDVSGHGINSALLMSSLRSNYRARAASLGPAALLRSLNDDVVHEVGATGMFVTVAALRIDGGRRMAIASAGHNPVLWFRRREGIVQEIGSHGPPLGFLRGAEYGDEQVELESGDVLLLYTDGISEASDVDFEMFGSERIEAVLREHHAESATAILDRLFLALEAFTGRQCHEDDVSVSVIKVR